jgi:hypothetical protein
MVEKDFLHQWKKTKEYAVKWLLPGEKGYQNFMTHHKNFMRFILNEGIEKSKLANHLPFSDKYWLCSYDNNELNSMKQPRTMSFRTYTLLYDQFCTLRSENPTPPSAEYFNLNALYQKLRLQAHTQKEVKEHIRSNKFLDMEFPVKDYCCRWLADQICDNREYEGEFDFDRDIWYLVNDWNFGTGIMVRSGKGFKHLPLYYCPNCGKKIDNLEVKDERGFDYKSNF